MIISYFAVVFTSFLLVAYFYPVQFLQCKSDRSDVWFIVENPITHLQEVEKQEILSLWYVGLFFVLYPVFMSWILLKALVYILNISFNKSIERQHNIQRTVQEQKLMLKLLDQEIEKAKLELA